MSPEVPRIVSTGFTPVKGARHGNWQIVRQTVEQQEFTLHARVDAGLLWETKCELSIHDEHEEIPAFAKPLDLRAGDLGKLRPNEDRRLLGREFALRCPRVLHGTSIRREGEPL